MRESFNKKATQANQGEEFKWSNIKYRKLTDDELRQLLSRPYEFGNYIGADKWLIPDPDGKMADTPFGKAPFWIDPDDPLSDVDDEDDDDGCGFFLKIYKVFLDKHHTGFINNSTMNIFQQHIAYASAYAAAAAAMAGSVVLDK